MSDRKTAKLVVRAINKGKEKQVVVPVAHEKDLRPVAPEQLSAKLRQEPVDKLHGRDVDFEVENSKVVRVCAKDEQWPQQAAAAAQQAPGPNPQRDFHNPYNFIPAPPRVGNLGELGDNPPVGHDRYAPNMWSGKITVRLITETPLLIPDAARMTIAANEHKTYPVRIGSDGKPYLPSTSIKGMLRAAYEAVTNSRFGVFAGKVAQGNAVATGHGERLAFRQPPRAGIRKVPARIVSKSGKLEVELLTGTLTGPLRMGNNGEPFDSMYAAWIWAYDFDRYGNPFAYLSTVKHRDEVWVYIRPWNHYRPNFAFWRVEDLKPGNQPKPKSSPTDFLPDSDKMEASSWGTPDWVRGYLCITNRNIDNKHDERVFFGPYSGSVTYNFAALAEQYRQLVCDYQRANERDIDRGSTRPPALQPYCVYSRHIGAGIPAAKRRESELCDGDLCYAEVKKSGSSLRITALFPVMISRELYQMAPLQLLSDTRLLPATDWNDLSPADRVFGWANQDGHGAYRGNLRIGPVHCDKWSGEEPCEKFPQNGLPLAILGEPKPQQARFYAAENNQGEPLCEGNPQPREKQECYVAGQGLRGRKVYPHHADLQDAPPGFWNPPPGNGDPALQPVQFAGKEHFREHLRAIPTEPGKSQRDNQNRSILGWVKPKTEFTFDIHVTNLSDVELGALLWLLKLPQDHFHRLGGGKPLGFGSVRLEIESLDLRDGEACAAWYRSLDGSVTGGRAISAKSDAEFTACVKAYTDAVGKAYGTGKSFGEVAFIKAFLAAAKGFDKPIHYPRVSVAPDPDGENFEWFVRNEKRENRHSLQALAEDNGLPLLDHP